MSERAGGDRYQRYLLGELPEEERDALEDEYFSTDEGFQELQAAEDELVDTYVAGGLSPDQRARFESRFLRTEEDADRVQRARVLQRAAARARQEREVRTRRPAWRWPQAAWAAGLAAVALCAALLVQLWRARGELEQARVRQEALERSAAAQDARLAAIQEELKRLRAEAGRLAELAGSAQPAGRIVSLVLRAGLRRDLDPVPQLILAPDATVVRFTLPLQTEAAPPYRVSVQTPEGREVWARSGLRPVRSGGGSALIVSLPAAALEAGHHVLVVSAGPDPGEPLAEYVFQAVRP